MKRINNKNAGKDWLIWGIPFFGGDKREVLKEVRDWLERGKTRKWVATVNPEFMMKAEEDKKFKKLLREMTDMNVVDGVGLVWARELGNKNGLRWWGGMKVGTEVLLGKYKDEVVAGSSLMGDFCDLAKKGNYRVFFLGGWGNRAQRTAEFFRERYRGIKTDWCSGEPEVKNAQVLAEINKFKPHFLFVAYGMKKQEEWIEKNLAKLKVGVVMGVGRSFDYYSGDLKRAPKGWQKMGLEWLYSLIKEPKRWRRQLALVRFVRRVVKIGI